MTQNSIVLSAGTLLLASIQIFLSFTNDRLSELNHALRCNHRAPELDAEVLLLKKQGVNKTDPFYPTSKHQSDALFSYKRRGNTLGHQKMANLLKKTPNRLVTSSPQFFSCNAPKSGCTAWSWFFLYVDSGVLMDPETTKKEPGFIHASPELQAIQRRRFTNREEFDGTFDKLVFLAATLDRFVFVRNPYIRFLSSYQDWLSRVHQDETTVSFETFTKTLVEPNGAAKLQIRYGAVPMNHIQTISKFCNVGALEYTVLRVEQQALWFNEFIQRYGLKDKMGNYTANGNLVFQSDLRADSTVADFAASIVGNEAWPSSMFESNHHRGSASKLAKYYTSEIAKLVTEYVYDDLLNFGYPLWDGRIETFRMV